MGPTSVTQLLILLVFVVPGFVHQSVRISVRGRLPPDIELSTRIVRAIVTSAVFGLAADTPAEALARRTGTARAAIAAARPSMATMLDRRRDPAPAIEDRRE